MKKEPLTGRFCVWQPSDGYRFGTDAVLLSRFACDKAFTRGADLCAGCGVVALLCLDRYPASVWTALDASAEMVECMTLAVRDNDIAPSFSPVLCDVRDTASVLPKEAYDLVTANPPYLTDRAGHRPERDETARAETTCTFGDVADAAKHLLRRGGRFCTVMRADRTAEIFTELHARGLEPKRAVFVQASADKPPYLVLCEAVAGGKPGLLVEKPLVLEGKP